MTTVLLILAVAIAALLALAATRPGTFRVERGIAIGAPREAIHPMIEDFRRWTEWSPWEGRDPAMAREFSGPPRGTGSVYGWRGNKQVGQGRMEILDSRAPERVDIQLDFIAPWEGHNRTRFALEPADGGTRVTWTMDGAASFPMKLMGLFMNFDRMIGRDFEAGLAKMKQAAEAAAR